MKIIGEVILYFTDEDNELLYERIGKDNWNLVDYEVRRYPTRMEIANLEEALKIYKEEKGR